MKNKFEGTLLGLAIVDALGAPFEFNKPDPRHLTDVIEITGGNLSKTIMVGDSEVDSQSAYNAKIPFILVEDGYTEKKVDQIPHDLLVKDFVNFEKTIQKYL